MAASSTARGLDPDEALATYFRDPDWMFKTGMGGMFNATSLVFLFLNTMLIPVSFCLWALVGGYVMRAARLKLQSETKLPDWNEWNDLIVSGLTWLAVYTGHVLLVAIAFFALLLTGIGTGAISAFQPGFVQWAFSALLGFSLISSTISFLSPLFMVSLAQEESMPAAFAAGKVWRHLSRRPGEFLLAWLISIGLGWAAILLPSITVLGIPLIPSTLFVAQVLGALMFAQVWKAAEAQLSKESA